MTDELQPDAEQYVLAVVAYVQQHPELLQQLPAPAAAAPASGAPVATTVDVIGPGGNVVETVNLIPGVPVRLLHNVVQLVRPDLDAPAAEPADPVAGAGEG